MTIVRNAVAAALRAAAAEHRSTGKNKNGALCAMALTLGFASAAFAQQPPAENTASGGGQSLDEVTVTGSRIRRTTDFDTANPTTVVDASYLQNLGIVNVGEAVKQLPANVSNNSPATTGNANFFAGSTIANLRGLNPFFGSRTLNLINSRRFVPTNQGDGVDLNFIPTILIERVDIVTGGASAAYGSGAVSGVNNVFLNRKLEGGKLEVDYSQTSQSDGKDKHAAFAFGTGLFEDKAHVVVGFEYEKSDPVGCYSARDWCAQGNGFYTNPINGMTGNRANGQSVASAPGFILGSNVRANQMSTSGVFFTNNQAATQTMQANAAGTGLVPFNLGQQPFSALSALNAVQGGDGRSIYQYTNLRAPVDRKVATGTFTLALTESVNMNVDLTYGKVVTTNITGALDAQNMTIKPINAYVKQSPALAAFVGTTNKIANKDWTSQVDSHSTFTTDVKRAAIGFDGTFGGSSWGWDGYYQYGLTNREQFVNDNRHLNAYNLAIDSVIGPNGTPVCRIGSAAAATQEMATNPAYLKFDPRIADGCVPLNPFGTGPISQAAHDYAFGFLDENLRYEQQVLALNASGDLFAGFGAGPIQAAIGVERRSEKGENQAAEQLPSYVRTDFLIQYGESFAGDVDVTEGYLEANLPVLKGVTAAKKLEFNLAARESRYHNQGKFGTTGESRTHTMFTWKAQGIWDPVDWLRIRATQSRDGRAANFRELYYGQKIGAGGTFGYCGAAGTQNDPCNWSLEGNVDLEPEKSDTTTMGLVFTPSDWMPGFQFAADYFRINISGAISAANVRRVLDGCQISGIAEYCALLQPDVPGVYTYNPVTGTGINNLRAVAFNGSGYTYKGVDFTGSYLWELSDASNLNFRLIATKMIDQLFQPTPGAPFINVVGQTGTANSFLADQQPTAEWVANFSATFNRGPLSVTGQARYVSDGKYNYRGVAPGDAGFPLTFPAGGAALSSNHVPSYAVFALSGSYDFANVFGTKTLQVYGVVNNLFDRDPPLAVGNGANNNGGTNAIFFDTMGRSYRLGARVTF
jgi:outer membrane receptor protein involved in Fe transport